MIIKGLLLYKGVWSYGHHGVYYLASAEGLEYPDLQVRDEVNLLQFLGVEIYYVQVANSFDLLEM